MHTHTRTRSGMHHLWSWQWIAPLLLWESGKVYEYQIVSAGIVQQDTSLPSVRALPSRLAACLQHRLKLASGFSTRQSTFWSSQLGGVPACKATAMSRASEAKSGEEPPSNLGEPRSLGQRRRDFLPPWLLCAPLQADSPFILSVYLKNSEQSFFLKRVGFFFFPYMLIGTEYGYLKTLELWKIVLGSYKVYEIRITFYLL